MTKIAIISDIHANLTALETVLKDIERKGITRIICLGDIIYKGASPVETIDLIKEKCEVVLIGNCDEYMTNDHAMEKRFWTRMQIGEEKAEYIRNLPVMHEFYMSGYLVRLFHASPFSLEHMYNPVYSNKDSNYAKTEIKDPESLFENTEFIGRSNYDKQPDIVGFGHVHSPCLVRVKNKMLFNVGSVGMPVEMLNTSKMDDTSKFSTVSSYAILEGEEGGENLDSISIQLCRVPYPIEKEIERIKASSIPTKEALIRKLQTAEP